MYALSPRTVEAREKGLKILLLSPDPYFSIDKLEKIFKDVTDKKIRNELIYKAYLDGYSQHQIAKVLNISQPAVYGIIKRVKDVIVIT